MKKSLRNLSSWLQSYLWLLNSFLFLSRFSVSLKSLRNYFFRRFAYKFLLNRFSVLINCICGLLIIFLHPAVFYIFKGPGSRFINVQVFQSSGFSGSRFFSVQVFQGPGFPGFRFFRVRVQGPGPGFRNSPFINILEIPKWVFLYLKNSWV